jgi:hypothetical protein
MSEIQNKPLSADTISRMNPPDPTIPAIFGIIKRIVLLVPSAAVGLLFLVPYLVGLTVYGRPPIVPSASAFANMFQLCLFKLCKERNYATYKIRLFLYFVQTLFLQPSYGVFWFLDDVLYPGYRDVKIVQPCFIIGDARTGTTQYVQILGDDAKNFCAPITLNALVPMLHAWKIGIFLKSFMSPSMVEKAESFSESVYFSFLPKEFQTRHEGGLWRPDTFEVQYNAWRIEFFAQLIDMNLTAENWWFPMEEQRKDFLRFLDAIWKKVAYHRGVPGQKMLIKGHFLIECHALEEMYPGNVVNSTITTSATHLVLMIECCDISVRMCLCIKCVFLCVYFITRFLIFLFCNALYCLVCPRFLFCCSGARAGAEVNVTNQFPLGGTVACARWCPTDCAKGLNKSVGGSLL